MSAQKNIADSGHQPKADRPLDEARMTDMNQQNKQALLLLIIFTVLIVILGFIFYKPGAKDAPAPISVFQVNPSQPITPGSSQEPFITQWEPYENKDYSFAFDVPKDWNQQEYKPANSNGGTLIAFSPDNLPCETCTYLTNGFFSIRIYNEKTYPERYAEYQKRLKNVGKSKDYLQGYLGGKIGLVFANTISVEHQGWVYELSLDKEKGKTDINSSPIFKRVVTSFRFTSLFNN